MPSPSSCAPRSWRRPASWQTWAISAVVLVLAAGGLPRAALHAQVGAALQVLIQVRRTGASRVLEEVCLLRPTGPDRLVTVVPAWRRGQGPGLAAAELAALLRDRSVPVPAVLSHAGTHHAPLGEA